MSPKGTNPNSLANLRQTGNLTVHGWWSKGIQTTGIPTRGGCPLRLLGNCDCEIPDTEQCPIMLEQFVARVIELQEIGLSKQGAELITRMEFQSLLGHYVLDRQGAFRRDGDDSAPMKAHRVWVSVGTVDHALERLYKAAGILRTQDLSAPSLEEYLAKMSRVEIEDDEEC